MYTSLGLTEKIWYWLILVFSWSELPAQQKIAIDHQGLQEFYLIPMEKDARLIAPFQKDHIDQCETKDLHSVTWNPLPSFQGFRTTYDQAHRPEDRVAKTVKKKAESKPMRINSKSLSAFPENARYQHQTSMVSQAPAHGELFNNVLPPRYAVLSGSGFMAFLIAGSVSYLYVRQYITKKRSQIPIEKRTIDQRNPIPTVSKNQRTAENTSKDIPVTGSSVSPEVIQDILIQLHRFEKEKGYLDKEVNLSKLAFKFKTNLRYLSHVINDHKKTSFPTYLKNLRITSAHKRLLSDPYLLRYNLEGLANEFGFKSGRTFSTAFSEVTGKAASKLLEELRAKGRSQNGLSGDDS